jgi:hypothetical protein
LNPVLRRLKNAFIVSAVLALMPIGQAAYALCVQTAPCLNDWPIYNGTAAIDSAYAVQSVGQFYNSGDSCPGTATVYNDLGDTLPHQEQVGEFEVFEGVGYQYYVVGTDGTTIVAPALPAGDVIVQAILEQVGSYTPNDACTATAGEGWPASPYTNTDGAPFNGVNTTGTVVGVGNFEEGWNNPTTGLENNLSWQEGAMDVRYILGAGAVSAGGGTYAVNELPAGGEVEPVTELMVVYANPTACYTGVVAMADGLYYWHPSADDTEGAGCGTGQINDGSYPLPTTLNWGCAEAVCSSSNTQLTTLGENDGGQSYYTDEIIPYETKATATTIPGALWQSSPAAYGDPPMPDINNYEAPGGVITGNGLTWDLGGNSKSKTSYLVNGLVAGFTCNLTTTPTTLVKSASETSADSGDTITFGLTYDYPGSCGSSTVIDSFTTDEGA